MVTLLTSSREACGYTRSPALADAHDWARLSVPGDEAADAHVSECPGVGLPLLAFASLRSFASSEGAVIIASSRSCGQSWNLVGFSRIVCCIRSSWEIVMESVLGAEGALVDRASSSWMVTRPDPEEVLARVRFVGGPRFDISMYVAASETPRARFGERNEPEPDPDAGSRASVPLCERNDGREGSKRLSQLGFVGS